MKVGEKYYIIWHAYHHYIGEVVEILGRRGCVLRNVIKVHSSSRSWTELFRDGVGVNVTSYDVIPDGLELDNCDNLAPWRHDIPRDTHASQ